MSHDRLLPVPVPSSPWRYCSNKPRHVRRGLSGSHRDRVTTNASNRCHMMFRVFPVLVRSESVEQKNRRTKISFWSIRTGFQTLRLCQTHAEKKKKKNTIRTKQTNLPDDATCLHSISAVCGDPNAVPSIPSFTSHVLNCMGCM
jgi:hypothetical protein